MAQYILVYTIDDYPETGGGTHFDCFGLDEQKLHERVNELAKANKDMFSVVFAGFLQTEYEYEPIESVIEYKPKRK